jgi:hypothetical protein
MQQKLGIAKHKLATIDEAKAESERLRAEAKRCYQAAAELQRKTMDPNEFDLE